MVVYNGKEIIMVEKHLALEPFSSGYSYGVHMFIYCGKRVLEGQNLRALKN
jgi:hypothetical protein